jgi:hypothetical protein
MNLTAARFCSLLFTALALGASLAHLFSLPNKIDLPRYEYLISQQSYRGWALLGIVVAGQLLSTVWLAVLVRRRVRLLKLTMAALLCIVGAQVIFWTFTFPANQETHNWTLLPPDWAELRTQWEYSHAAGAILNLAAFVTLVLSVLPKETGEPPAPALHGE